MRGAFEARGTEDGTTTADTYAQTPELTCGFWVLELPDRAATVNQAAMIAAACRCAQELREIRDDAES